MRTRPAPAKDLEVSARGRLAKGYDLLLSLHSNAAASETADYPVAIVPLDKTGDKLGNLLTAKVAELMKTKQIGRIMTKKGTNGEYYGC